MAAPPFFTFFSQILRVLDGNGTLHINQIRQQVFERMHLSEEDLSVLLPSGMQRTADNRITWALSYLKKAGLVESPFRSHYQITPARQVALQEAGDDITLKYLEQFESFRDFRMSKLQSAPRTKKYTSPDVESSPTFVMDNAFRQINDELAVNLLQAIEAHSLQCFEKLVVELLSKMGYSGAFEEAEIAGQTENEGFTGIIKEDKLGFSSICIQAKCRNADTIFDSAEVQKFVGALAGQGMQKGLFITTAKFTKEAQSYAAKQSATKVVLVDGEKLAKLMIEYNVGVSTLNTYAVKRIDSAFFDEDDF